MIDRILIGVVVASAAHLAAAADRPVVDAISNACGDGGNRQQVECLAQQIDRLNVDLDQAYQSALAKLSEQDPEDQRRSRGQLRQSETAWLQYKQQNCALMGAMEGGSNAWITHFEQICDEQEIQARTRVLQQIAAGAVGNR